MRHLDYDSLTGMETLFHYDEATDTTTLGYRQHTLDQEMRLIEVARQHAWDHRMDRKDDGLGNPYAHVPPQVHMIWLTQFGVDMFNNDHKKKVMSLLNSPEWKHLKIASFYHQPK